MIIYQSHEGVETKLEARRVTLLTFSPDFDTFNIMYRLKMPTTSVLAFPETVIRHQKQLFDSTTELITKRHKSVIVTYSDHVLNTLRIYAMRKNSGEDMLIHYGYMYENKEMFMTIYLNDNGTLDHYPKGMCDQWDEELHEMFCTMWSDKKTE